jgi:hypothetical protein
MDTSIALGTAPIGVFAMAVPLIAPGTRLATAQAEART